MPLSKKKKQAIKHEAQIGASQQPTAKDALEFQQAYEEIIGELNEKLETRLDTFNSDALPILREAYPTRPNGILSVMKSETDRLRDLTQIIITNLEPIKYPPFRAIAAECIKDIVDICSESVMKQYQRAQAKIGELLQ